MVHALQEALRVLDPHGTLVDVRPICVDAPLEILSSRRTEIAGLVDMSPDIDDDIAADSAIKEALGALKQVTLDYFDFAYYWNTVDEMKADFEERWKEDAILPEAVLEKAHSFYQSHRPSPRVRLRIRMKLAAFMRTHLSAPEPPR